MGLSNFACSKPLTLGVELELQLVNTHDYDLVGSAEDLLRLVQRKKTDWDIKPEITKSMIEIATSVCQNHDQVLQQLQDIREILLHCADRLDIGICGGGTHTFQHWGQRKIYDTERFNQLSSLYGYLAKQFTIFGQHIHIGCPDSNTALYTLHSLSRYIPHFIALSGSSPFVQGHDTGFHSARLNSVFAFPLSGRAPFLTTWAEFGDYFSTMEKTGIVTSMKDFYWDIRPKPEFGTIEIRIMDTPLTITRAAYIAAFAQSLARYLMMETPFSLSEQDYLVYSFNRFQACRFGADGVYVDPSTNEHRSLLDELKQTFARIEPHAIALGADTACASLLTSLQEGHSDTAILRQNYAQHGSLHEVVQQQCARWRNP